MMLTFFSYLCTTENSKKTRKQIILQYHFSVKKFEQELKYRHK